MVKIICSFCGSDQIEEIPPTKITMRQFRNLILRFRGEPLIPPVTFDPNIRRVLRCKNCGHEVIIEPSSDQ